MLEGSLIMDFLPFGESAGDRGALSGTLRDSQVRTECPCAVKVMALAHAAEKADWGEVRRLLLAGPGLSLPPVRVSRMF